MSNSDSLLSRFMRGTISIGLGNLSTMVLGLSSTVIAARHLPTEAFGAFVLLEVIASFLTQMSSFGLDLSMAKFVTGTEEQGHKCRIVNTAISFRLFIILIISPLAWITRPFLFTLFGSSLPADLLFLIPLFFLLESLHGILKSALQGFFRFREIGIADFIASFFNFLLIVIFVLFSEQGLVGLVYAKLISLSLSCVFAYFSLPLKRRLEFHFDILKEMLAFGFPLQMNDILTFIFRRIDTLIIGALLGPADIAYYEIARKIPDSLTRFYEAFRAVFFPFMSKLFALGERKRAIRLLNNSTRFVSFISALGLVTVLAFGNDLIRLLFSEKYLPAVPVFILLMVTLNIALVSNVLGTSLVAVGESNKPAIINTVHTGVGLLCNWILIPLLGFTGAALASLAGTAATNPLNVLFLRRKIEVNIADYLKPIAAAGVCLGLDVLLKPSALLQRVSLLPLFLLLCVLLSVITRDDLAVLLSQAKLIVSRPLQNFLSRSDMP